MIIQTALLCLALNIYHEARSEGYDGMAAVAVVTMNRAAHNQEKVCDVVFKPYAFSWANKLTTSTAEDRIRLAPNYLPKDEAMWQEAKEIATQAIQGTLKPHVYRTVKEADHYYNPSKANPYWKKHMRKVAKIGDHAFYDSKLRPRS